MHPYAEDFDPLVPLLLKAERVLIGTHESPEGDCIGASLALSEALTQLGKHVIQLNPDPVPRACQGLHGWQQLQRHLPSEPVDLVVVLDCGELERVGPSHRALQSAQPLLNIDHHRTNRRFGTHNVVDPLASSTCELLFYLLQRLPITWTETLASSLYAGISVDTGSFRYASTTERTLRVARELVLLGANPATIATGLYESMSHVRLKLLPLVLQTLSLSHTQQVASILLTREMLSQTGGLLADTEGFINYPRSLEGVEVAVFYKELAEGFSVSLRSKARVDIGTVASRLGGGGHKLAAAFRTKLSLEALRAQLEPLLSEALADVGLRPEP